MNSNSDGQRVPSPSELLQDMDRSRIDREWQMTNTLWAFTQRLVALVMLVLASPLLLVLYLPVRLNAKAPFFFRQERPGFMGKSFRIVKITTMRAGSENVSAFEHGVQLNDPSVTRIGRILRDTKLDELPQLWNVICGDMEFVGPRPIAPGLNAMLSERIPGFSARYLVKPGLTNIGQVCVLENALGDDTLEDWKQRFEGEEHYIQNKSVSYDLILIFMTVVFVTRKAFWGLLGRKAAPVQETLSPSVAASEETEIS
ncbi:MAG: lipopolysaccharide/colanic/teichoic acid biosynthesis glycosyltransferase [Planctomycetota bacterium]|jgi:lipopolysaccharide/colanic/teichoic acid biosynthesis glycosyltransferase